MEAAFAAPAGDVNVLVDQTGNRDLSARIDLLRLPAVEMLRHPYNLAAGD